MAYKYSDPNTENAQIIIADDTVQYIKQVTDVFAIDLSAKTITASNGYAKRADRWFVLSDDAFEILPS